MEANDNITAIYVNPYTFFIIYIYMAYWFVFVYYQSYNVKIVI